MMKRVLTISFFLLSFLIAVLLANKNIIKQIYAQVTFDTPVTFSGSNSVSAPQFIDTANSSYYLDPAATGNSLLVAGNIGIGTTGPQSKLDFGTSVANQKLIIGTYTTGNLWTGIGMSPTTAGLRIAGDNFGGNNLLDVGYYSNDASHNWTSYVFVNGSGSVGIGTTAPAQKLSVVGTIESTTGGFKFPDATTQTTAATSKSLYCFFVDYGMYAGWVTGDQMCSANSAQCVWNYTPGLPATGRCDQGRTGGSWCYDQSPGCSARCCRLQ